jgi:hypothetical protein
MLYQFDEPLEFKLDLPGDLAEIHKRWYLVTCGLNKFDLDVVWLLLNRITLAQMSLKNHWFVRTDTIAAYNCRCALIDVLVLPQNSVWSLQICLFSVFDGMVLLWIVIQIHVFLDHSDWRALILYNFWIKLPFSLLQLCDSLLCEIQVIISLLHLICKLL